MRNFREFLRAAFRHWKREVLGGVLIGLLALYSEISGVTVPPRVYEMTVALLIFYAMYLAWRDEHERAEELEKAQPKEEGGISAVLGQYLKNEPQRQHTEATDRLARETERLAREMERQRSPVISRVLLAHKGPIASVKFAYEDQRVYLLVTNNGLMADFYGRFSINGGMDDLFCRWMHDPSVKTKIVKGQTCRILLAELVSEHNSFLTMRWKMLSHQGEIVANYTSVPNAQPEPARAPDLILDCAVMAEPDLENGIQKCRVVLEAFGARLAENCDDV
jgi:hypothetical protein